MSAIRRMTLIRNRSSIAYEYQQSTYMLIIKNKNRRCIDVEPFKFVIINIETMDWVGVNIPEQMVGPNSSTFLLLEDDNLHAYYDRNRHQFLLGLVNWADGPHSGVLLKLDDTDGTDEW